MTMAAWIGVWLLVAGVVAIVFECALAAAWGIAFGKRTRALALRLEEERALLEEDIARLRAALEETSRLWRPYNRALRWLRHPITIALLQSYARRRAAAR
ncbi:MAG: hypothetical protein ABI334_10635 [Candidatus Dormiibacterota bacterium]